MAAPPGGTRPHRGSTSTAARRRAPHFGGGTFGTSLHGLFEQDGFRAAFLGAVADRRGKVFTASGVSFSAARQDQFDRLADLLSDHVDLDALDRLIACGSPGGTR